MLRRDAIPFYFPLLEFPRDENAEYMLDHYQAHLSNARLLGLPGIPDISSFDLQDEGQFRDFLAQHAIVHLNENRALNLV